MSLPRRQRQYLKVSVTPARRILYADPGGVSVVLVVDIRPVSKDDYTPQVDLRGVLDRSASMTGTGADQGMLSKIKVVKEGFANIVANELSGHDRLMLTIFNKGAEIIVPHGELGKMNRQDIVRKIRAIIANGSTHFSEAMGLAMKPPTSDGLPARIVFLTDGQSEYCPEEDYPMMEHLAEWSHDLNLPWLVYATGVDYNMHWLRQVAMKAAPGSAFKHVSSVATLEADLQGQLAFMRGIAVDRLVVSGKAKRRVSVDSVTRIMPLQHDLDVNQSKRFEDRSGALDNFRGQQYMILLSVANPVPGERTLLDLTLKGNAMAEGYASFKQVLPISIHFSANRADESPLDDEVRKIQQMVIAGRMVKQGGDLGKAADLYDQSGMIHTADEIRTLNDAIGRGGDDAEDAYRSINTVADVTASEHFTQEIERRSGKKWWKR